MPHKTSQKHGNDVLMDHTFCSPLPTFTTISCFRIKQYLKQWGSLLIRQTGGVAGVA